MTSTLRPCSLLFTCSLVACQGSGSGEAGSDTEGGTSSGTATDGVADTQTSTADDGSGDGESSGGPIDPPPPLEGDLVTYAAGNASTSFHEIVRLSDGSFLVAGAADHLEWIDAAVPRIELGGLEGLDSSAAGRVAFLLHLSANLGEIVQVAAFPEGTVEDITRIRTNELPGQATGDLYVSGRRTTPSWNNDGYFIARLDGNFVQSTPSGAVWGYEVVAEPRQAGGYEGQSSYELLQPWDVDADGGVVFGQGSDYDFGWAAIYKLDASGQRTTVEHWPIHWGDGGEHYGLASDYPGTISESGIVLKAGRIGSLRSRTQADYDALLSDGNGSSDRQGRWPDDYFFSGPCIPGGECPGGPGYTGYRTSDKPTQRLGGIAIDRRDGSVYFGYSTQSVLPGGNPDFEPVVVALGADGQLEWWNRLYRETTDNSSPDQYVDGITIDHANDRLVVLARAHGNNVSNLWQGNDIAARPEASAFQNQFTGTNGNIHISWLGKLALTDGELYASTYVAEFADTTGGLGEMLSDPNLDGWPSPNGGWPDVNTTRCSDLAVDPEGRVAVACQGRRTITTAGAHQKMPKFEEGSSAWNSFVRLYAEDFSTVEYSTLLVGSFDAKGVGGDNTSVRGIEIVSGGVAAVGVHLLDDDGVTPRGEPVPTTAVPAWGASEPAGQAALLGHYELD